MSASLTPAYFEALYTENPDPWRFASSPYEQAKYAATLAALPNARFRSGFEIGCSIGVLTAQLAPRCDRLLAVDVAETALAQARARLAPMPHVAVQRLRIPRDWPDECFDLMLFSEVLYYLAPADLAQAARHAQATLQPGGTALLVHYTLPTDYPLTGDAAAESFIAQTGFSPILRRREAEYRLDLLRA